jgi:hypothetical protein
VTCTSSYSYIRLQTVKLDQLLCRSPKTIVSNNMEGKVLLKHSDWLSGSCFSSVSKHLVEYLNDRHKSNILNKWNIPCLNQKLTKSNSEQITIRENSHSPIPETIWQFLICLEIDSSSGRNECLPLMHLYKFKVTLGDNESMNHQSLMPTLAEYNQYLWDPEFTLAWRTYKRLDLEASQGQNYWGFEPKLI